MWELAVIEFNGPDADDFSLTYETPVTDDVIGHLSLKEIDALLGQIAALST